ncbi:hypothetical protein BpJC7_22080 [Weizmannia acidilactici]|uniref:Uncharacterized protein n=1 Tax=Weizmannia acidilactici TaxID=2607726 RepID=A0A5J4JJJ5_9BACI|nr:hypothetical protein BpJC4_12760 [Weizmannia acidilactici]GER70905.1 hypothetical protein BpJC7_22080 [Weizmannia acidilactici]
MDESAIESSPADKYDSCQYQNWVEKAKSVDWNAETIAAWTTKEKLDIIQKQGKSS